MPYKTTLGRQNAQRRAGLCCICRKGQANKSLNSPYDALLYILAPISSGPLRDNDLKLLRSCSASCLELDVQSGIEPAALCCIPTDVFHSPADAAASIKADPMRNALRKTPCPRVIFNVFSKRDHAISKHTHGTSSEA